MPKRKNLDKNSLVQRKSRKISMIDGKRSFDLTIPVEIITKIIANLTDISDIKNCMNLSKDVNEFFFRTPKIIHDLKFNVDCTEKVKENAINFINTKGKHIKFLTLNFDSDGLNIMKTFFNQAPILEKFRLVNKSPVPGPPAIRVCTCCGSHQFHGPPTKEEDWKRFTTTCWSPRVDSVELPKLKSLELELRDLDDFIRATKTVGNLEVLVVHITPNNDQRMMNEFIMQQHNLKELSILVSGKKGVVMFPTRNVSQDANFQLRKLKVRTKGRQIYSDMVDGFLMTQANCLEELEVDFALKDSNVVTIFTHFTTLRKLVHKSNPDNMLVRAMAVVRANIETLTHLEDLNPDGLHMYRVWWSVRNILTLKCVLVHNKGGHFMLHNLDVEEINLCRLRATLFPVIKNITIGIVTRIRDEDSWMAFIFGISRAKNVVIKDFEKFKHFEYAVKSIMYFERLETFSIRFKPGKQRKFVMEENEEIPSGYKFYKILIDTKKRTVKVSNYIVRRCPEILKILDRHFGGFEFYEFCYNILEMQQFYVEDFIPDNTPYFMRRATTSRSSIRSLRRVPVRNYRN